MSAPKTAEYVKSVFVGGDVKLEVTDDQDVIAKEYPLMAAVNRCANTVKEHQVAGFSVLNTYRLFARLKWVLRKRSHVPKDSDTLDC
ncbi:hypothetical protein OESDEN_00669 [Oesophagostomum dentatum]|uniref:Uncharacterized protein n=1 Tax=Oesophagostomum dentatum TaxID=61180 RepID=A0A0B1TP44_OESDE|nr:hypothetical protein OESDEN_00669 [Oesophagostomum dentatum]